MRGSTIREGLEGDFGGGVFGLTESRTIVRTLKGFAVKVNGGFKPRRVVWTFPNARVGRKIKAAPLR